jgi:hypothetical protein
MEKKFTKIIRLIKFEDPYLGQNLFIFVGLLMVIGTLLKLTKIVYFDSDWFWFIAGLGLTVEATSSFVKQKRFNSKYKILTKEEFERLSGNSNIEQ